MTKLKTTGISITLIVINGLIAYYLILWSILVLPIIIGFVTFLCKKANINIYLIAILIIIILTSNDILLRLTVTNKYDFEGAGVDNVFFLILVCISVIISCFTLFANKKLQLPKVILFAVLIFITSYIYISYFDFFGLINYSETSKSKEIAKYNKFFLNDLKFSSNQIIYKNDTLQIVDGWSEKQIIINHEHLLKNYDSTSTINYTIKLKSNVSFHSINLYYKVNDANINGSTPIDSTVSFNSLSSIDKITLYIFTVNANIKTDTVIKKIVILK